MMSGDHSPIRSNNHEMFEFNSSTPPSTSKECNNIASDKLLKSSVIVDASETIPSSDTFSSYNSRNNFKYIDSTLPCVDDQVPLAENEDLPNTSGTSDETKDDSKLSEDEDKLDGNPWVQKDELKENEEDFCFKCLYISMQCCECSIM